MIYRPVIVIGKRTDCIGLGAPIPVGWFRASSIRGLERKAELVNGSSLLGWDGQVSP